MSAHVLRPHEQKTQRLLDCLRQSSSSPATPYVVRASSPSNTVNPSKKKVTTIRSWSADLSFSPISHATAQIEDAPYFWFASMPDFVCGRHYISTGTLASPRPGPI